MIWLTWRQFRTQLWIAVVGLVAVAVTLTLTGRDIAHMYADSGLSTCRGDACSALANSFLTQARSGATGLLLYGSVGLLYVVPALIGVFWGAPLVSRELEAGTHRLVWNQSVTRYRWLAVKLAGLGLASMATAALLSLSVSWSAHRVDQFALNRIEPLMFAARGIVPIGYAAFAFVLGVTVGIIIRRTVPAMAVTLAVYAGCVIAMSVWVRAHLLPAKHSTVPFDVKAIHNFTLSQGGEMRVQGTPDLPGAWILSNRTITPTGQTFHGPANPAVCGPQASPKACMDWVGTLGLRQDLTYQPASNFWPLQWAETGVFLALAAVLVAVSFWWLRRRIT
jgi:ABC-type transport system involved in multi-copper enzyme maturation permease subunit